MCTETLIENIRKAEQYKILIWLKVVRESPAISHLFFADDNLVVCKAQKNEYQTILHILKDYGNVSGQQISLAKSSLQFGRKIGDTCKIY